MKKRQHASTVKQCILTGPPIQVQINNHYPTKVYRPNNLRMAKNSYSLSWTSCNLL